MGRTESRAEENAWGGSTQAEESQSSWGGDKEDTTKNDNKNSNNDAKSGSDNWGTENDARNPNDNWYSTNDRRKSFERKYQQQEAGTYGVCDNDYRPRGSYTKRHPREDDVTEPNETLGIFGFPQDTTQEEFDDYFREKLQDFSGKYETRLIMNRLTGLSKRFGFLIFDTVDNAVKAKEVLVGGKLNGLPFRVSFSNNERKRKNDSEEFVELRC